MIRGHPSDYDRWAGAGAEGWSWDEVSDSFRRLEGAPDADPAQRGTDGPLHLTGLRSPHRLSHAFVDAAAATGLPRNRDFNAHCEDGAGLLEVTQLDGRRHSAADAYLAPVRHRRNLQVATDAHVTRIRFSGSRAVGVTYRRDGRQVDVDATIEVVCSAGAVSSPQLLLLSGVGPTEQLRHHGIPPVADVPGVGQNLHDHPLVGVNYRASAPATLATAERPWNLIRHVATYLLRRHGPLTTSGPEAAALLRSDPSEPAPDLLVAFAPAYLDVATLRPPSGHGFGVAVGLLHPSSRGRLSLASADPTAAPIIDPDYLGNDDDRRRLVQGLGIADAIVRTDPLGAFCDQAVAGWAVPPSDEELGEYVRRAVGTFHHPVGTCRMGTDDEAVVAPDLTVHGVDGLRVVDASVMPATITGGTNATTIMIAEKAADHIRRAHVR